MKQCILTERAEADLTEIWRYIADDNPAAADKVAAAIEAAIKRIVQMPETGHRRRGVPAPRYRFWIVYSYVIAYFPDAKPLTIVRIVHERRDFTKLFK